MPVGDEFDLGQVADRIARGLAAQGIRGPFDLAGHSLGGGVALTLAASRPRAVRRLVLVAPAGLKPLPRRIAGILASAANGVIAVRRGAAPLTDLAWGRRLLLMGVVADGAELPPSLARRMVQASSTAVRTAPALRTIATADLRPLLTESRTPLGVIWGEADQTIPVGTVAEVIEARPDAMVVRLRGHGTCADGGASGGVRRRARMAVAKASSRSQRRNNFIRSSPYAVLEQLCRAFRDAPRPIRPPPRVSDTGRRPSARIYGHRFGQRYTGRLLSRGDRGPRRRHRGPGADDRPPRNPLHRAQPPWRRRIGSIPAPDDLGLCRRRQRARRRVVPGADLGGRGVRRRAVCAGSRTPARRPRRAGRRVPARCRRSARRIVRPGWACASGSRWQPWLERRVSASGSATRRCQSSQRIRRWSAG